MTFDTQLSEQWEELTELALAALALNWASVKDLQAALEACRSARPLIGELAIRSRRLSVAQVMQILRRQAGTKERFGEIAVQMGYLDGKGLFDLLRTQAALTPPLTEMLVKQRVINQAQAETLRVKVQERLQDKPPSVRGGMAG